MMTRHADFIKFVDAKTKDLPDDARVKLTLGQLRLLINKPVKPVKKAGRPRKWTDQRYLDWRVRVEVQMWVRKLKIRPTIEAMVRELRGKPLLIDVFKYEGMKEPVEVTVPDIEDGHRVPARSLASTLRKKYSEAVALIDNDPGLLRRYLKDLADAKRWHGVIVKRLRRS